MPSVGRILLVALAALLCTAPTASAKQVTVERGSVTATLSYSKAPDGGYGYVFDRLQITRDGVLLHDGVPAPAPCREFGCGPTIGIKGFPALRVRDLDADDEPEVLLTAFTGGAHCCVIAQILELEADRSGYEAFDFDFGNGGFSLRDPDGDGRPEFFATDESFAYRFTAYAFSGRPIVITHYYGNGDFLDLTGSFPGLIRRDARAYWRGYLKLRHNRDNTQRGQIAPWAADRYRLGRQTEALRVLRREARRGFLGRTPASGQRFVKVLHRFLIERGYGYTPGSEQPTG
jgi:hypothetical protein